MHEDFLFKQIFYDFMIFYELDFTAFSLGQATVQHQIEAKSLRWSVTFGLKSVEKRPLNANVFYLETPSTYRYYIYTYIYTHYIKKGLWEDV